MPSAKSYVCCLTETHVQRIEALIDSLVKYPNMPDLKYVARDISIILRGPGSTRRKIGPKAKTKISLLERLENVRKL